ncbi:MAG: glycosyltransferase [Nitrospira sp.]
MPIRDGVCTAESIYKAILLQQGRPVLQALIAHHLHDPVSREGICIHNPTVLDDMPPDVLPLVTVAVCTRDRSEGLYTCLHAVQKLDYPSLDRIVIDNAPQSDRTERMVRDEFPAVRYVRESRPGLDWARNRALAEARGEIVAFTDDDVSVDAGWVRALAQVFVRHPEVMAVTGLVVPAELETSAQILFETYGGFGRGFEQRWYRAHSAGRPVDTFHLGAGVFGTGANMAYRRTLFKNLNGFDPALDVGTVTNGGGDLEMFFRVLQEGYVLVYEPQALVRHRHRRTYRELATQLTNHGVGLYSYLSRCVCAYPALRPAVLCFGARWFWFWNIRRLLVSYVRRSSLPRHLMLAELRGSFRGLFAYQKARRTARSLLDMPTGTGQVAEEAMFLKLSSDTWDSPTRKPVQASCGLFPKPQYPVAVRAVELSEPLTDIGDLERYKGLQLYVTMHGELLGKHTIEHIAGIVPASQLRQAIAKAFGSRLLSRGGHHLCDAPWSRIISDMVQRRPIPNPQPPELSAHCRVSIVIATLDRPEELRHCLGTLSRQESSRQVEIVVVDNNPASGLTATILTEFPAVVSVQEARRGLSYARNAGIMKSSGDIIIMIDDDVTVSSTWLERLIGHFSRPEVMAVTGNVLPLELDTEPQVLFETYGGLGRGFERLDVNGSWLRAFYSAPRTWVLGATANAAFRASVFRDERIGLLDEALGAGMAGVGEDTYLFYRILRADHTLVYEPSAYVWHKHRRDVQAFRRQLFAYSKGHVAYHLTTLFRDGDLRVLLYLFVSLPRAYVFRVKSRLLGRTVYPLSLLLLEILGNLIGPWTYLACRWKASRHSSERVSQ